MDHGNLSSEFVRYVASDGVNIVADVMGDPECPTIILAHGGGQTRFSWSGAMHHLAGAGFRVINYDARGHGQSDWSPDGKYPIDRRWADLSLITNSVREPLAVVGASMGGISALHGVSRGFRPNALVLVDISPNPDRAGMQRVRDFMASGLGGFATLQDAADAVAAYNPEREQPGKVDGLRKNLRQREDGRWYWHWDPEMVRLDIEQEHRAVLATMDGLRAAGDLPVLLVRGLQSDVVTDDALTEFKVRFPKLEAVEISGAGHMVAGDKNDVFNGAVVEFLSRKLLR
jgi:pimeloyl-ACP methyl ester carboxylesterase